MPIFHFFPKLHESFNGQLMVNRYTCCQFTQLPMCLADKPSPLHGVWLDISVQVQMPDMAPCHESDNHDQCWNQGVHMYCDKRFCMKDRGGFFFYFIFSPMSGVLNFNLLDRGKKKVKEKCCIIQIYWRNVSLSAELAVWSLDTELKDFKELHLIRNLLKLNVCSFFMIHIIKCQI